MDAANGAVDAVLLPAPWRVRHARRQPGSSAPR